MQNQELILSTDPASPGGDTTMINFVVSPTMREFLELATERGLTMEIKDDATEAAAAENLNNLAKGISSVEDAVKAARRPLKEAADAISAKGREVTELAARAKAEQEAKLLAYREEKKRAREAALKAEQERQEKERKDREAAAAEAQRKADELKLEAERKQREAERQQWEARERERLAAAPLMDGPKLDAQGVTEASEGLATAAEADAKAAAAQLEADQAAEAQRLAIEEADRLAAEARKAPTAPAQVIPTAPAQVKGIKTVKVITIDEVDLELLPAAYRLYDETKIKKHLADGIKIPGVKFREAEMVKATKR